MLPNVAGSVIDHQRTWTLAARTQCLTCGCQGLTTPRTLRTEHANKPRAGHHRGHRAAAADSVSAVGRDGDTELINYCLFTSSQSWANIPPRALTGASWWATRCTRPGGHDLRQQLISLVCLDSRQRCGVRHCRSLRGIGGGQHFLDLSVVKVGLSGCAGSSGIETRWESECFDRSGTIRSRIVGEL